MHTLARRHLRVWLMVALTVATGMLDAVGYLALDRVFTGNMTGNVLLLGMGLAAIDGLAVAGPLAALLAYVAGAAAVGRLLRGRAAAWSPLVTAVLLTIATVLVALAALLTVRPVAGTTPLGVVVAAAIATLMGAQAATARSLAVPDMTTVVVTSTLIAFASETLLVPGRLAHRRLWAIVAMFAGALLGALALRLGTGVPVCAAAAVSAVVALIGHRCWSHAEP